MVFGDARGRQRRREWPWAFDHDVELEGWQVRSEGPVVVVEQELDEEFFALVEGPSALLQDDGFERGPGVEVDPSALWSFAL